MTRMNEETLSRCCLDTLTEDENGLVICLDQSTLPDFLVEANEAIRVGNLDTTRDLLNEQHEALLTDLISRNPTRTDVMFIWARLLKEIHSLERAEHWYKRIVEVTPNVQVYLDLHKICAEGRGRLTEAIDYAEQASRLDPDNVTILMCLGKSLIAAGQRKRGRELLRKTVRLRPDLSTCLATLLWYEHYFEEWGRTQFYQAYQSLSQIKTHDSFVYTTYDNDPNPERRLRIGLLSSNFMNSSAAFTLEPFLDGYDRDTLEVVGYGNVAKPDHVTDRMTPKLDGFTNIFGLPYGEVARLIRADKIDILVEVAGLCADNSLGVMKYQAAPVQVDWGGLDTSAVPEIAYRFSDIVLDPPDRQRCYLEETVYLKGGMFCFRPVTKSPLVGPLPALRNGFVTFGSFNNCKKISDTTLATWVEVLQKNPNSHLFLKLADAQDELVRKTYLAMFTRCGIAPERIHIKGHMSHMDHFQVLGEVDIMLDTFPFNGFVSTFDALWMGVPVVSLCGETWVGRGGASILKHVGLDVFVAYSPQEYVQKACAFANQLDQLNAIRHSLRPLLLQSPLCDCRRLAWGLEKEFRFMWRQWVSKGMTQEDGAVT